MGSVIPCFFLEPAPEVEESLRRFSFSSSDRTPCNGSTYHNAEVTLGTLPWDLEHHGRGADDFDHDDPRWPKVCDRCGYVFQPKDEWQHNLTRLWIRKDTGEKWTLSSAPPGAMWYADWLGEVAEYKSRTPDGGILILKTPGGDWNIDAKSSNGDGWTRSGTPPKITANPSILIPASGGDRAYHGWLRDGQLIEC